MDNPAAANTGDNNLRATEIHSSVTPDPVVHDATPSSTTKPTPTETEACATDALRFVVKAQQLTAEIRQLLGRSPYLDPALQVELDAKMRQLAAELDTGSLLQLQLTQQLARSMMEIIDLSRQIAAQIELYLPLAAKEVIAPGYANFFPLRPGTPIAPNSGRTAFQLWDQYGRGMHAQGSTDEAALKEALEILAKRGQGEAYLRHVAYGLALPVIERLEKMYESRCREQEGLITLLFLMKDKRAAVKAKAK